MSIWTFEGQAGQMVKILIDSGDSEARLMLDILDQYGKSIISGGALYFTGRYDGDNIKLPNTETYTIQVFPSTFEPYGWHGWYEITLK
jgi:hypothetical protein